MGAHYFGYSPNETEAIAIANLRAKNHPQSPCFTRGIILKPDHRLYAECAAPYATCGIVVALAVAHNHRGSCKMDDIKNDNYVAPDTDSSGEVEEVDMDATPDDWFIKY